MTALSPPIINVTFWGTRGSISTPGRSTEKYGGNTPCVSIQCDGTQIVLDAGTGIRNLGLFLEEQYRERDTIPSLHLFLTHTHWDHIQGLPFFQVAYIKGAEVSIYGSQTKERFLESILQRQMNMDFFPVGLWELAADVNIREIVGKEIRLDSVVVDWQEQVFHPGGSVRYRITAEKKRVVYATDVELDRIFNPELENSESEAFLQQYIDFIQGVDLLIADGQYTEEEYREKVGWGHSSVPVILDLAIRAKVKQLAIFHHDPDHSDKTLDRLWRECRSKYGDSEPPINIFWAREGMTVAV